MTQIIALFTITANAYLGIFGESSVVLKVGTLLFALSSFVGYFNQGGSPILRILRFNFIPMALAVLAIAEITFGNGSGMLLISLFTTIYLSATYTPSDEPEGQSLLRRFALTSWRNDNEKEAETLILQSCLIVAQTYLASLSIANGSLSLNMSLAMAAFIFSQAYSCLSPVNLAATNLLQSNTSTILVLAAGVLLQVPSYSFNLLLSIVAVDCVFSLRSFYN